MMELTKEVALFLHGQNLLKFDESGLTGNTFIQSLPDQPNESVAIFSTGGPEADRENVYGYSTIQILIRTIPHDPRLGEEKAQSIIDALNGFNSEQLVIGGHYIVDLYALQSAPNNIGKDENDRYEYSQNFMIEYLK